MDSNDIINHLKQILENNQKRSYDMIEPIITYPNKKPREGDFNRNDRIDRIDQTDQFKNPFIYHVNIHAGMTLRYIEPDFDDFVLNNFEEIATKKFYFSKKYNSPFYLTKKKKTYFVCDDGLLYILDNKNNLVHHYIDNRRVEWRLWLSTINYIGYRNNYQTYHLILGATLKFKYLYRDLIFPEINNFEQCRNWMFLFNADKIYTIQINNKEYYIERSKRLYYIDYEKNMRFANIKYVLN